VMLLVDAGVFRSIIEVFIVPKIQDYIHR